jgi:hypothetical protein
MRTVQLHTPSEVSIKTFNEMFLLLFVEKFGLPILIQGPSQLTYDVSLYILQRQHRAHKPVTGTQTLVSQTWHWHTKFSVTNLAVAHKVLVSKTWHWHTKF